MKLKLYLSLIKKYLDDGNCPDKLELKKSCGEGSCEECRIKAIEFCINTELFDKLKNNFIYGFGLCPKDIDFEEYEDCINGGNCRECRKQAIERIENNEC